MCRRSLRPWALTLLIATAPAWGQTTAPAQERPWIAVGHQGMVASDSVYAS